MLTENIDRISSHETLLLSYKPIACGPLPPQDEKIITEPIYLQDIQYLCIFCNTESKEFSDS